MKNPRTAQIRQILSYLPRYTINERSIRETGQILSYLIYGAPFKTGQILSDSIRGDGGV